MASKPISIAVKRIKCVNETSEVGDDEPFVVVFAADITPEEIVPGKGFIPPRAAITVTGNWTDVNDGETHGTVPLPPVPDGVSENAFTPSVVWRKHCWGLANGEAAPIDDPDNVILLVGMFEQDDGDIPNWRGTLGSLMTAALAGSVNIKQSRAALVGRLKQAFLDGVVTMRSFTPTAILNPDDIIGTVKELHLTKDDLKKARVGVHERELEFKSDGAHYIVTFEMSPHDGHLHLPA